MAAGAHLFLQRPSHSPSHSQPSSSSTPTTDEENALLLLHATRILLTSVVASIIGTVLLFDSLKRLAFRVSGFRASGSAGARHGDEDEDEDEEFDDSLAGEKARIRRLRVKRALEAHFGGPPKQPRKLALVLPLILVTLTYTVESAGFIVHGVLKRNGRVDEVAFWPAFVAMLTYWLNVAMLHYSKNAHVTESLSTKVTAGVSITLQLAILVESIYVEYLTHTHDPFSILFLVTNAVRFCFFIALCSAYLPRFMAAQPTSDSSETERLLTGASDVGEGTALVNGDSEPSDEADGIPGNGEPCSKKGEHDDNEEEEEDIEDEVEKKVKDRNRTYNITAVMRRLKRLLPYLVPVRSRGMMILVFTCITLTLLMNACKLLMPRQQGLIIADLVAGRAPWRNIFIWVLLETSIGWGGVIFALRRALWIPIEQRAERELNVMSFRHVLELSARYHQNKKTGEVMSVLNRADSASDFLSFFLFEIAPLFIDLVLAGTYVTAVYGPSLTAVAVVAGGLYLSVAILARPQKIERQTRTVSRSDRVSAYKNESVSNVDLVKYFSAEQYEIGRYIKGYALLQKARLELSFFRRMTDLAETFAMQAGILLGSLLVARQIDLGYKDVGSFVAYTAYMIQIMSRVQNLTWMNSYFTDLMTNTDKLIDILDEKNEILDKPDAEELYQCRGEVEFENVSFTYPTLGKTKKEPKPALQHISFKVKPGMHVALVGETGSGKSTIFKLLFRFFDVSSGSIKVDGKDIRDYTQSSLRHALGVVQQEGALFNDTIMANIRYGDITASDAKVMQIAKAAKIHEKVLTWPKKYYTVVGERGIKLSGGEKQRVSIARTLLKNPDILLLDEATSALDTNTEKDIQAQLREMTAGKTTLAIAHRLSTIAHADLILVLKDGCIVESGSHAELSKKDDGQYRELWNAQIAAGNELKEDDSSLASNSAVELRGN